METTTTHPNFIKFIDEVVNHLNSSIDTKNYFSLTDSKKKNVDQIIYQTIIKSFKYNVVMNETEGRETFDSFRKFTEQTEDYVLAGIFKNIKDNIETHIKKPKTTRRRTLTKTNPDE